MKIIDWIRELFIKKEKAEQPIMRKDSYAPRRRNIIYPNDEFAQEHINEWLDDVFDKHHGW